jgi:hypothetical protein
VVVAGDDHVLRQRRQRGDDLHAQRAHRDPGAGGQLEVLGDAAVEDHALLGPRLVGQQAGVADAVVAFFVEGLRGEVRGIAVAGEDADAAHAQLELLPEPLGRNFSSMPGSGRPMTPARSSFQWALVMAGEVSVEPQEVVNHTGSSRTSRATASSRSQVACGSAAPA